MGLERDWNEHPVLRLESNRVNLPDLSDGKLVASNPKTRFYRLGFPNLEVEEGFVKSLIPHYTRRNDNETTAF